MTPEEIIDYSKLECTERRLYDQRTFEPNDNSPLDPILGVSNSKGNICATCGKEWKDCPGHFGHIKLALPVFHVGFFEKTIQTLQVICKRCRRVLLSPAKNESRNPRNCFAGPT